MTCYFGAHCLMRSGLAICDCSAAECPATEEPPVCGSDGRTYLSACHLRTHACRTQSDVVVQAFGPCSDESPHVRRGSRSGRSTLIKVFPSQPEDRLEYEHVKRTSQQLTDASVDTSDSGKPDSPEPELTCVDILPPVGYR